MVPADAAYLGNLSSGKGFWIGFSEEKNKQGKKKKTNKHFIKSIALLIRQIMVLGRFVYKNSISFQIRMQNFQYSVSATASAEVVQLHAHQQSPSEAGGVPTTQRTAPANLRSLPCPHGLLATKHQATSPSVFPVPKVSPCQVRLSFWLAGNTFSFLED